MNARILNRSMWHRLVAVSVLILALAHAAGAQTSATPGNSAIDAVWAQEEAYWRYVQAGDVESYIFLWHERFRGWPCHMTRTATKAGIGDWVREVRDKKVRFTYELTKEGAEDFGNVVVVYYRTPMVREYPDGRTIGKGREHKFTHTWLRVGDSWQIIGGMCADLKALE